MAIRVTDVQVLDGYQLRLTFNDGLIRDVDLSDMLRGEMGEPLRDPDFFRQVRVDPPSRSIVWPNGLDLDPDVLHGDYEPAYRASQLRAS